MVQASENIVVVDGHDATTRQRAETLANQLGLSIQAGDVIHAMFVLGYTDGGLELRDSETRPGRGLLVDFKSLNPLEAMRRGGFSRKQPLARAIGKDVDNVLDATAGLAHDAALLACMGYHVTAVERSPILAALIADGLRRAMDDPQLRPLFEGRLTLINADSREFLQDESRAFDSIYIDPMFPPKRKSFALAKKSIRLVRALVGDDPDATELLNVARRTRARVAVKRPTHALPLGSGSIATVKSKLVRYDIYKGASEL